MERGRVHHPELTEGPAHRSLACRRLLPAVHLRVSNRQLPRVEFLPSCWKQKPGVVSGNNILG